MSAGQAWNNARRVLLVDVNNNALVTQPGNADDQAATDRGLVTNARLYGWDTAAWDRIVAILGNADGQAVVTNSPGFLTTARTSLFNGATWDRQRGNTEGTLLASAARTTNATSATQTNHNARGVLITLSVTVASGTGGLTLRIYAVDPVTGSLSVLNAAPTAITAAGLSNYVVYPGVAVGATLSAAQAVSVPLPRSWAIGVTHGDASSYTYSIAFSTIV